MWDGHNCVCVCARARFDLYPQLDVVQLQQRVGQYHCKAEMEKVGSRWTKGEKIWKWKRDSDGELASSREINLESFISKQQALIAIFTISTCWQSL